jgi:hypothetical protein
MSIKMRERQNSSWDARALRGGRTEPTPRQQGRSYAFYGDTDCRLAQSDVFDLWRTIEAHQMAIAMKKDLFEYWLRNSPELAKDWEKFLSAGGVTAEDYNKYCENRFRHRVTREKKHLRLIRNKNSPPVRCRAGFRSDDDDAA